MRYADRRGKVTVKDTFQDRLLEWLYGHAAGRLILKPLVRPWMSIFGGYLLNTSLSAALIPVFVRKTGMDLSVYERPAGGRYGSYNEFFTRKIRPVFRPVNMEAGVLVSPCDGRATVCPIDGQRRFSIKNTEYTVESLIRSRKLARRYEGGYACVFRLTVEDYHRYCYMDSGVKSRQVRIPGLFHTVNPAANDRYPIYKENTREYCLLRTEHFGTLLTMEVGALLVGKIKNFHPQPGPVRRGEEKGLFEFGGSTVVVLIGPGRAVMDEDLLINTKNGIETVVKMGERIGCACDPAASS